jgi:hypothetical protein
MAEKLVTRVVNQDLVDHAMENREKRKHQNREDGTDGSQVERRPP